MDIPLRISRVIGVRGQMKAKSEKRCDDMQSEKFWKRRAEKEHLREGLSFECNTVVQMV